jgi:hypothetical protein
MSKKIKMSMFNTSITFFCISAFFVINAFSCKKQDDSNCKDAICTQDFRTLNIQVIGSITQNTVVNVLNASGGIIKSNIAQGPFGQYPVFSDGDKNIFHQPNIDQPFTIEVRDAGTLLGSKVFNFGMDCCHVFMVNSSNVITIP